MKERVQTLIELSGTVEDANKVIENYTGITSIKEKIAFLRGMFEEVFNIGLKSNDTDEKVYNLMLVTIIKNFRNN